MPPPRKSARLASAVLNEAPEAPLYALPKDPPARQVIQTAELVKIITGFLNDDVNASGTNKKALVGLTTVNRPFFDACTDILWASMHSFSPFIKLLPPSKPTSGELGPEGDYHTQQNCPWTRFCVYSPKTRTMKLAEDEDDASAMPTHWFFYLYQHHSRPVLLFPNMFHLKIASMDSLNAILPFHFLPTIKTLYISNFLDRRGKSDTSKSDIVTSLLASLASGSSPSLWKLTLRSHLLKSMASVLPHISTLTKLNIALDSPSTSDNLAFLNTCPSLKDLSLCLRDFRHSSEVYPQRNGHLLKTFQPEAKFTITTLSLDGDPFSVFSAASLFASPSLHTFTAKFPASVLPNRLRLGLFLVPHIFHLIAHYNPWLRHLSIHSDQPVFIEGADWDRMENDDRLAIPDGFFPMITRLKGLKHLSLEYIPFLQVDFAKSLLLQLGHSPCLQSLCLVPRFRPCVASDLPNLDDLRVLSLKLPSLKNLTISLTLDLHPPTLPDLLMPGHGLRSLLIIPQSTFAFPPHDITQLVPLVKYLDRVFPQLVDVSSHHKPKAHEHPVWRDIEYLLKSYQSLRRDMAALLGGD